MRHNFAYTATYSCSDGDFKIIRPRLDLLANTTSKRDVFMRGMSLSPAFVGQLYVFNTLAEADAVTGSIADTDEARDAAGVTAYNQAFDMSANPQSVVMTNNSGVLPDMTGLAIEVDGDGQPECHCVYGYAASPESYVGLEIISILQGYTGTNKALAGFTSAAIEKGPVLDEYSTEATEDHIYAALVESRDAEATTGTFGLEIDFYLIVGMMDNSTDESAFHTTLMGYAGNVRSILMDEVRQLNGLAQDLIIETTMHPRKIEGPENPYDAVELRGHISLPYLYSDV